MRYDPTLEEGVKKIRWGSHSLNEAADSIGVAPSRLRQYLIDMGIGVYERGRWRVGPDTRPRRVPLYSRGKAIEITVRNYGDAVLVGMYMSRVGRFLATNEPVVLADYVGDGVVDVTGRFHPFETDPNALYRLGRAGPEPWEQIYRIVV